MYYATGSDARGREAVGEVLVRGTPVGFDPKAQPVEAGPCRVFIGVRSDPFFADDEGPFHDWHFTGEDTFAGKNILCMALEVTDDMLGPGPEIAVWATSSVRRNGELVQVDRFGNPSFNPFFVDELKNKFNAGHPADDLADFLEPWSKLLETAAVRAAWPKKRPSRCFQTSCTTTATAPRTTPTVGSPPTTSTTSACSS